MARRLSWAAWGAASILLAAASGAHAQVAVRVDDLRIVEGSSGTFVGFDVDVRVSGPPSGEVTVGWTLVPGSAVPGADYQAASGVATFPALDGSPQKVTFLVNADTGIEWFPAQPYDEAFFVELGTVTGPAFVEKARGTVTLVDDDRFYPGVQFSSIATGGALLPDEARVQWRVPAAPLAVTDHVLRWNVGPSCSFPTSVGAGTGGTSLGPGPGPGLLAFSVVGGLAPLQDHCFSLFAVYGGTPSAEVGQVKARPFDGSASPIAWRLATGELSVVPPTVGVDAVYTVDSAGVVHAMERGPGGGAWPVGWSPVGVGGPTQARAAVVPQPDGWRLLLGTDGGGVHALDARFGHVRWSRSALFGSALPSLGGVQAQPAALLLSFGGSNDLVLVGSNQALGNNAFFALDPRSGADRAAPFADASMGNVRGMAAVDYPSNRAYFLTDNPAATLFALDLGPPGSPSLGPGPLPGNPLPLGSGTSGSPVVRGGRLVFGDSTGEVFSIDLVTGASYSAPTGDGQLKGFAWPDRRDDRLYFATNGKVHGWRDDGGALVPLWSRDVTTPSIVLQRPGSDFLYVGNGNGELVQIDAVTLAETPLSLESGSVQVGAPSLDGTHDLVLVGSSSGTIHAVRVPY